MISIPPTGGVSMSFWSNTSAGGQSEQPSEVKSSTMTGVGGAACGARGENRKHEKSDEQ